jgi:hypothetical protein
VSRNGVLIITNERDVGADYVVRALERRGVRVVRLNTERLPGWRVELEPGKRWTITREDRQLHSGDCSGVWWRRPEPVTAPIGIAQAEWNAATKQAMALLHGMQHTPGPTWVSAPAAILVAEDKALQLAAAADIGFDVPATTWTNDVGAAKRRLMTHSGAGIVKATTTAYWESDETSHFVFAHPVRVTELPAAARLAAAPLAFQQRIKSRIGGSLTKRDGRGTTCPTEFGRDA